jgi:hydroxyethylthiazole kinase-like uncharacterized protein yjeF
MERASETFVNWFTEQFPDKTVSVYVFCGNGNNGGDGLAISRLLHQKSYDVNVAVLPHSDRRSRDNQTNLNAAQKINGLKISTLSNSDDFPNITDSSIVIDALFGTGLKNELQGLTQNLVGFLNQLNAIRVAVDTPSGLFGEKSRGIEEFLKKKEIFREDDHANYLYFSVSGKVKCEKTDTYGKSFVTEIYNPGDFLGYLSLLEGSDYKSTAVAMEKTRVAIIPKDDFLQLIQKNKDVSSKFIKMLSGNVIDREKRLIHLAYSPVGERVAQALYKLANNDENKKANTANINLSREDLANIVGTVKETLIRMLSELKKEGVIELVGREITVVDMNRLKASADDF